MKIFNLLLFLLFVILLAACKQEDDDATTPMEDPNLGPIVVNNAGFENQPTGWPDGWWHRTEPYQVSWTMDESFSGNGSVTISSDTLVDDFNYWGQSFNENIQAGKKLRLQVNVKLDNVVGEGISIVIRGDDTDPFRWQCRNISDNTRSLIHHWDT